MGRVVETPSKKKRGEGTQCYRQKLQSAKSIRTPQSSKSSKRSYLCASSRCPFVGCFLWVNMKKQTLEVNATDGRLHHDGTIILHSFAGFSPASPAIFLYLLKECYVRGTCKATYKFKVLQQEASRALCYVSEQHRTVFIVQCLYLLPLLGPPYTEGFSHLLISSLRRIRTTGNTQYDSAKAKQLSAQLFLDVLTGTVAHEERILLKMVEVFDISLKDIANIVYGVEVDDGIDVEKAKEYVKEQIFRLIESHSYMTAVSLLQFFSIHYSEESFLHAMVEDHQLRAAEKWATCMGKPMISLLVQKCIDMKLLKPAYEIIKKYNLKQEFPEAYRLGKESSLKQLAEKGCWDVAEMRANSNKQLIEYLVCLAMEAGYTEKVDELCKRYSLNGFGMPTAAAEGSHPEAQYLHCTRLDIEDIVWVDELNGLLSAISYIEGCKVVGLDCEWKPNFVKGAKPNKVSIMQIASGKRVYILDLIKLCADEPDVLDNCLKRVFGSSSILKLGYNFQSDLQQLSQSYSGLGCFKYYEMLLDIQKLFKDQRGGLSGLAKNILGAGLNKTRRNSNWEQRPLSPNQIEYAALDAAVLVHIFHNIRSQLQFTDAKSGAKTEWRSYIVSHMGKKRPPVSSQASPEVE
ncbi:hypothetical protein H6P81_004070 [Aristolochia fimbriata]|uniref:3'-5' exonuclease domain-containing protein n=1 Tax=Aristolochia fimbriata TaxID=158543 RepID=A0AAV7FED3_ARIFI|nr:hypothetical protein H6P81_004070 [Aristolochia fimbriata]